LFPLFASCSRKPKKRKKKTIYYKWPFLICVYVCFFSFSRICDVSKVTESVRKKKQSFLRVFDLANHGVYVCVCVPLCPLLSWFFFFFFLVCSRRLSPMLLIMALAILCDFSQIVHQVSASTT
jgi:hypothetical protein